MPLQATTTNWVHPAVEQKIRYALNSMTDTSDFMAFYTQHVGLFRQHVSANYTCLSQRLGCGTATVQSSYDLLGYMVLYGGFLYQCLQQMMDYLFNQQAFSLPQVRQLHVVDYACGQGSATLVLLEQLCANGYPLDNLEVTLIEPSAFSLQRAAQLIEAKAQQHGLNVRINQFCCGFDELPADFLAAQTDAVLFHLFANILDLYCFGNFDLPALVAKIKAVQAIHYSFAMSTRHPKKFNSNDGLGFEVFHQHTAPASLYFDAAFTVSNVSYYRHSYDSRCMVTESKNVIAYASQW